MVRGQHVEVGARNVCDFAAGQRDDAVIHVAEDCDVQVAKIAWYEKGDDLPRSVGERLVPRRPAFNDDVDVVGALPSVNISCLAGTVRSSSQSAISFSRSSGCSSATISRITASSR
jgi:hypothetical protein